MADPTAADFVISQGDTLPVMHVRIPRSAAGELIDLTGKTITFFGRAKGSTAKPPPIIVPVTSVGVETIETTLQTEAGPEVVAEQVAWADVKMPAELTETVGVPVGMPYQEMEGELEIIDGEDVLTVPSIGYLKWFIRDDVGKRA